VTDWNELANAGRISAYPSNLEDPWPPIEPSENPGRLEPIPCGRQDEVHDEHPWEHPEYGTVGCLGVGDDEGPRSMGEEYTLYQEMNRRAEP
jgi:hypothetical protein